MDDFTSSHAIIKALKGSEDPPVGKRLSKIEIARKAWKSTNIHFPNKDEVLAEWILSSFIKHNKDDFGPSAKGLVLSPRHWSLLNDIVQNTSSEHVRQNRVWLSALLTRVSILNIVTIFFKCLTYTDLGRIEGLLDPFTCSLNALWPLAAIRMNLDSLTDCLGQILEYLSSDATRLNELASVCLLVTRTFKQAVGNTTTKKKAFSWFTEQSFLHWVQLVCLESSVPIVLNREAKLFISEVYQSGIDVFFCLDSLKSSNAPLESILLDPKYSLSNMQSSQYQIVLMLYKSYVQELRRHRFAVFGSGSSQAQEQTLQNKLREVGLKAFGVCYKVLRQCGDVLEVWQSVLTLVEALEEANLVGYGQTEGTDVLNEICESTITILAEPQGKHIERTETALQILCAVSRIDFDFLSPFLSNVLSGLLTMNPSLYPSTQSLLRGVLDFHSKTRTMPSYLSCLLETLSNRKSITHYPVVPLAHQHCTAGVLFNLEHMEDLSRYTRNFLTPGQTQEVVDSVLGKLQDAFVGYLGSGSVRANAMDVDAMNDSPEQKHRNPGSTSSSSTEHAALQYSLVARVVSVIFPSLPFSSLSETAYMSVQKCISAAWTETVAEAAQTAFTTPATVSWAAQCVSTASLRIRHALLSCSALRNLYVSSPPIGMTKETNAIIRSYLALPELVIELFRAFFDADFRSADPAQRDETIDALIIYLNTNLMVKDTQDLNNLHTEALWDASTSSLNPLKPGGHKRGALAVWHLLLDRWLPIVDEIALQGHLKLLSELLLARIDSCIAMKPFSGQLSFSWILERAMRSAAFWELPNLRDALILTADSSTQCADWESFAELLRHSKESSESGKLGVGSSSSLQFTWTEEQTYSVQATFKLLLRAPREYLPRSSRTTFVRRALVADLAVSLFERNSTGDSVILVRETRTMLRSWLVSMSDAFDIVDVISEWFPDYIEYLMHPVIGLDDACDNINVITLELLSDAYRQTIRHAVHGREDLLQHLCTVLQKNSLSSSRQFLLRFIEILVAECPASDKISSSCVVAVRELYHQMQRRYSTALTAMSTSVPKITGEQVSVVRSWRLCLVLRKWLNTEEPASLFGTRLIQQIMPAQSLPTRNEELEMYCTQVFILLLEEFYNVSHEEQEQHLSLTISAYILLIGRLQLADQAMCDAALERAVRSISIDKFAHVLCLLREALEKGLASGNETRTAVHLSSVLLGDAPEGAMKITQEHFEECLHIFCNDSKFVSGDAELSLEVVAFIGKVCSEKAAYLRPLALGPIWLLLAELLTGSTTHTQQSYVNILHGITTIASSLIRLRRDLVTSTLPHLGAVMSSLIRSLRAPRAQLGARQRTQVADTLPWWVSPSAPLGIPEARAVARLLTSLQAKTVPRTFTSRNKEKDKERSAESLMGAFSKHAGPVLGAYISALVDPLVVVDAGMREALAPGLYALCEAMGERGRDALMASGCDAVGRTVLKALWKEYDKQRYVGKG